MKRTLIIVATLILLTGCRQTQPVLENTPGAISPSPSFTPTHVPTSTPTMTPTATPTPTPTATPTPTSTAQPVSVSGDGRSGRLFAPTPQAGAPCGIVDVLDFPLDPPDAQRVAVGGQDFGDYRPHFEGYHAGEDWWRLLGEDANFGVSVHSIGHGQVTYAAPNGWGVDQGTVVIRHTFPDGNYRLSFYGHLDPPSVVLRAGDCVARGDVIGEIGHPRGAPHLHFEIRTHMPDRPGPGYWGSDPLLAGWEPPSQFIWDYRIATSPGVVWTQSTTSTSWQSLGELRDGTFGILEDTDMLGINLSDGSIGWRQPISTTSASVMVNVDGSMIYVAERNGTLRAFGIPDSPDDENAQNASLKLERSLVPLWNIKLGTRGLSTLLPLPGEGIAVFFTRQMFGISSTGQQLWNYETMGTPQYWALGDDYLVVTLLSRTASLWMISASGAAVLDTPLRGKPAIVEDQIWVYDAESVCRLHPETLTVEPLYTLPLGFLTYGDIAALPNGGVLLAHMEYTDKYLIALNIDSTLHWQRSYANIIQGKVSLQTRSNRVYAVVQTETRPASVVPFDTSSEIAIFAIDTDITELTRIFTGATRRPDSELTAVHPVGENQFLINLGGVSLTLLDLQSTTR